MRGLKAEEYDFAWRVQQDLLPIGSRLHRPNADRRCKVELAGDRICQDIQTIDHLFITCERVKSIFGVCKRITSDILQKEVTDNEILMLGFNHRNKLKLRSVIWFVVKMMYKIYLDKFRNRAQLLKELIKDIDWNIQFNKKSGSKRDYIDIKLCIQGYITN